MNNKQGKLLLLTGIGMDLFWLQAWAAFLVFAIFNYQIPFLFTIVFYTFGLLTSSFCFSRLRFRIINWTVHLLTFCLAFFLCIHLFVYSHNNHPAPLAFSSLIESQKGMAEWGLLLLLLVVSAIIWQRSAVQVLKPLTEENVYLRFDLGISAFLVLLIVKTMLLTKGGIVIERPVLEILFIPFFAMGFLTVGLMLNREAVFKSYLTGFHKIGIAISFAFVVLTTGVCVVFIFQSQLVSSAEIITDGLKKAGRPLLGIFIAIIRFLFRPRHFEMESKRSSQGSTALGSVEGGEESGFFEEVLQWGIVGFTSLVLLVSLFIIFRILLGYLLSRSNSAKDLAFKFPDLADWIRQLKVFIRKLLNTVFRLFKKMKTGSDFYKMLIRWGRHSGVSCHQAETPLEYSQRLSHSFPELTREIDIIADLIHQDLYADKELSYQQIYLGRKVGRRMRNPVFWAKRLKSWIVTSDS